MPDDRNDSMRTTHVVRMIARREIYERLRGKTFTVLTGILVFIILAIGVINRVAGDGGAETILVGATAPIPIGFESAIAQTGALVDRTVAVRPYGDAESARRAVDDGDVDVAIIGSERQMVFSGEIDDDVRTIVQQAWTAAEIRQGLVDAGLSPAQVSTVLSPPGLDAVTVDGDSDNMGLAVLTGTLTAILLFISLQTFGNYVLVGVVEEKSTAVIELLLARVRADQLLAGKVIGIGVVALLQFVLATLAGLVSLAISGTHVPGEIWSTLPVTIVWFLGGYALYSTLFALAGSLVSRQEDAPGAAAPIMTALVGAYLLVFVFGYVPESGASRILSIIPPIAPFLMPMRMAAGAASVAEIVAAMVLLLATTFAVWKLAGKVYEQVLLRRGSRIAWRDALALLRRA
ncbi:MAG: ABC transporter permease [Acidimicrobiales bacterium]